MKFPKTQNKKINKVPIQLKIKNQKPKKKSSKNKRFSKSPNLSFKSLGLPPGFIPTDARIGRFGENHTNEPAISNSGSLLLEIRNRITEHRYYPQALIDSNISGVAKTRLIFNRKGLLCFHLLKIEASSPFIKVLLMRILTSAFREPIKTEIRPTQKHFTIDLAHGFFLPGTFPPSQIKAQEFVSENSVFMAFQAKPKTSPVQAVSPDEQNRGILLNLNQINQKLAPRQRRSVLEEFKNDPNF